MFDGFDPPVVARFGARQVERLLADPGIVRNRAKIEATINNARRYAELAGEFGSLAAYVWRFEPAPSARPAVLDHATLLQIAHTPESVAMSKDLRRRGWSFVGPTTVYAFMQAMGLVNDHLEGCDRRHPVERERRGSGGRRPGRRGRSSAQSRVIVVATQASLPSGSARTHQAGACSSVTRRPPQSSTPSASSNCRTVIPAMSMAGGYATPPTSA